MKAQEAPSLGPPVIVDPEFKALIPPHSPAERLALEESLLKEGCRDALVVWKGTGILVEGYTRYEICQQRQVPYRTVEREFPSREAAEEWMIRNQLGRRNLAPFARAELFARLEPLIAARAKENQKGGLKSANPVHTKVEMAKLAEMSPERWRMAKRIIRDAPPEIKEQLRRNEITINAATKQLNEKLVPRPASKPQLVVEQPQSRPKLADLPPFLVSPGEAVYIVVPLRRIQGPGPDGPYVALIQDREALRSKAELRPLKSLIKDIHQTLWPAADRTEAEGILAKRQEEL